MQIVNQYKYHSSEYWALLEKAAFIQNRDPYKETGDVYCRTCNYKYGNYYTYSGRHMNICKRCADHAIAFGEELRRNHIVILEFNICELRLSTTLKIADSLLYICGIEHHCGIVKSALGDLCGDVVALIILRMFNAGLARIIQ